jgi:hypothetical protein
MPFTFSHPVAAVPLRRWCPEQFNFAGLSSGSMSPDFGYYIRQFPVARFAHTVLGTLAVCVPTGLIALAIFRLLQRPLCFVLPQPHRAALTPLAMRQPSISLRSCFVAALSILLGAWTHTVWDSFTHNSGWAVERLAILCVAVIHVGSTSLPVSYVLQQLSTFGGGALLAILYFRWVRRQRTVAPAESSGRDGWRYSLIALLAAVSLVIAVPTALHMGSLFEGFMVFRVFVFRASVYSITVFVPLLIVSSTVFYVAHRKKA